jgi:hypothetical protein
MNLNFQLKIIYIQLSIKYSINFFKKEINLTIIRQLNILIQNHFPFNRLTNHFLTNEVNVKTILIQNHFRFKPSSNPPQIFYKFKNSQLFIQLISAVNKRIIFYVCLSRISILVTFGFITNCPSTTKNRP